MKLTELHLIQNKYTKPNPEMSVFYYHVTYEFQSESAL